MEGGRAVQGLEEPRKALGVEERKKGRGLEERRKARGLEERRKVQGWVVLEAGGSMVRGWEAAEGPDRTKARGLEQG